MRLLWADQSLEDLADIWEYVEQRFSSGTANAQILRLQTDAEELLTFPLIGRSREDLQSGLRSYKSDSYFIFYKVNSSTVEILHVYHGRRDLEGLFN